MFSLPAEHEKPVVVGAHGDMPEGGLEVLFEKNRVAASYGDHCESVLKRLVIEGTVPSGDVVVDGGSLWAGEIEDHSPACLHAISFLGGKSQRGAIVELG